MQSFNRHAVFLRTLAVKGSKIVKVADDENKVKSQANQDAITVVQNGNEVIVKGDIANLYEFESTDPNQGSGKWVGLVIDTGEDSIIGVKYNGYDLTQTDVEEAASVGVGAGKFVLWIKAEAGDKQFTLSKAGKDDTQVKVVIKNTAA